MFNNILELLQFTYKQALCCVFAVFIFAVLGATSVVSLPFIERYDLIFIVLILFQVFLLIIRYEDVRELKAIMVFHIFGLVFEIFKVNHGIWTYPEEATLMVAGVPLYSGFMYSSVASYIIQASKRFKLQFTNFPSTKVLSMLAAAIYINFITNLYIPDLRIFIFVAILIIFAKSKVRFINIKKYREMHLLLGFFLISLFIWLAENISTFLNAWVYPHQQNGWKSVDLLIISSWFLLVVFVMAVVRSFRE